MKSTEPPVRLDAKQKYQMQKPQGSLAALCNPIDPRECLLRNIVVRCICVCRRGGGEYLFGNLFIVILSKNLLQGLVIKMEAC